MKGTHLDNAVESLATANADLEPGLLSVPELRERLQIYAKAKRLAAFGEAAVAAQLDDAAELARVAGTSIGKARETVATGKVLSDAPLLSQALKHGDISFDQASEIAKAEGSAPGSAAKLVAVAKNQPFHVLKERARATKLEAEQHEGLAQRQHAARCGRSYSDDLGMVNIHLCLEPHVGTPIVARAEAEAQRLAKVARKQETREPFECYLADAYAKLLSGTGKGRARRPELVVVVSHSVAKRGWSDVRKGELCKIPGVGPVSPSVAKEIAKDAFLNGVFYDGKDLRQFARWTRNIPIEVSLALELGDPPEFDGVSCVDCGNRFRTEFDHVEPHTALGPASNGNLKPRCWTCHQAKTKRDRKAGKLKPRAPDPERAPPQGPTAVRPSRTLKTS